jgi:hypothetical protein
VFEFGSWKQIISVVLRQRAAYATFFADSDAIHADSGAPAPVRQRVFIDLKTGTQRERVDTWDPHGINTAYFALTDRKLLGDEYNGRWTDSLVSVELPDYSELQRVPFAQLETDNLKRTGGMSETSIMLSDNRSAYRGISERRQNRTSSNNSAG